MNIIMHYPVSPLSITEVHAIQAKDTKVTLQWPCIKNTVFKLAELTDILACTVAVFTRSKSMYSQE